SPGTIPRSASIGPCRSPCCRRATRTARASAISCVGSGDDGAPGMSSAPKVWLAGARGMLGSVIATKLSERSIPFVGTDVDLDVANAEAVDAFLRSERPSVILNAAAYTRVDDAESQAA